MELLQEHMVTKEELSGHLVAIHARFRKLDHGLRYCIDRKLTELKGDLILLIKKGDQIAIDLIKLLQ